MNRQEIKIVWEGEFTFRSDSRAGLIASQRQFLFYDSLNKKVIKRDQWIQIIIKIAKQKSKIIIGALLLLLLSNFITLIGKDCMGRRVHL